MQRLASATQGSYSSDSSSDCIPSLRTLEGPLLFGVDLSFFAGAFLAGDFFAIVLAGDCDDGLLRWLG